MNRTHVGHGLWLEQSQEGPVFTATFTADYLHGEKLGTARGNTATDATQAAWELARYMGIGPTVRALGDNLFGKVKGK